MQVEVTIPRTVFTLIVLAAIYIIVNVTLYETKKELNRVEFQCTLYCKLKAGKQGYYDKQNQGVCQCGWGTEQTMHVHGIENYSLSNKE